MAVMVMMFFPALTDGNHAAMCHFTHSMLKLNRGVVDAKAVMQALFNIAQNALAD